MLTRRVAIGSICYGGGFICPPDPFCWSFAKLAVFSQESLCQPGEFVHLMRSQYARHDFARNEMVEKFLGDWLFFVDADHEFSPDLLSRLVVQMVRHGLDVVCGLYANKHQSETPILYMRNKESGNYEALADFDRSQDLVRVDSTGGGCLLVKRKVFNRIANELGQKPFSKIGGLGEDHSFCLRLEKLGIPLCCAWKVQAGHLRFESVQWNSDLALERAEIAETNRYKASPIVPITEFIRA